MRYVIYLLVVANCLYFAWNMLGYSPQSGPARNLPSLPADVRPLTTLQEREASDASTEVTDIEKLTGDQPPGAVLALTCQVLGPFLVADEMQAAADSLSKQGYQPQPRSSEIKKHIGYWVYLPILGHEQARQVVEVLKENDIKDYFIGVEDIVSLGIYRELDSANKRRERIQKLGFEPLVEPRLGTRIVHWLDLENLDAAAEASIRETYPEMRLQELACR